MLCWVVLGWIVLTRVVLCCVVLDWVALGWAGLDEWLLSWWRGRVDWFAGRMDRVVNDHVDCSSVALSLCCQRHLAPVKRVVGSGGNMLEVSATAFAVY